MKDSIAQQLESVGVLPDLGTPDHDVSGRPLHIGSWGNVGVL